MATTKAYSIFDNKALIFHPPYYAPTDGHATRSFSDLANDPNTSIGRHPSDYSLWLVGTFDDGKGFFSPVAPLIHVIDAIGLVQKDHELPLTQSK